MRLFEKRSACPALQKNESELTMSENHQNEPLEKALSFMKRVFGFHEFRPGQDEILESVLDGSDSLVIMPTGGGKSLCYQVPAFIRPGITLVISPLIALMKDQVDSLHVLDLPVTAVHSLMGLREQEKVLHEIAKGKMLAKVLFKLLPELKPAAAPPPTAISKNGYLI